MRRLETVLAVALLALPVGATLRIRDDAKKAGFGADNCNYCHSFSTDHMRERARQLGVHNFDCGRCHGGHLPKMGAALFNARGLWLLKRKTELKAERVEADWLKDYVEKDAPAR